MVDQELKVKKKPRGVRRDRDCFTCKERQVKCDLNRPSCAQCVEAGVVCGGYPPRVVWTGITKSGSSSPRSSSSSSVTAGRRVSSKTNSSSHHSSSQDSPGTQPSTPHPLTTIPAPIPTPPAIHSSASSSQLSVAQQQHHHRQQQHPQSYRQQVQPPTNFAWGVKAILAAYNHAKDSETTHNNVQSTVLSTIWKFVSSFLNNNRHDYASYEDFSYQSLKLKAAAIQGLKEYVNEGILEAVFAILAFTYFEVCQGSFGEWSHHLRGARSILDIHCPGRTELKQKNLQLPGLKNALTLLTWYDVTGAIATGDRDLIFADWHREEIDDGFFHLVGCPKSTFRMFADIVQYQCSGRGGIPSSVLNPLNSILKSISVPPPQEIDLHTQAAYCWQYGCLLTALANQRTGNNHNHNHNHHHQEQLIINNDDNNASTNMSDIPPIMNTLVDRICTTVGTLPDDSVLSQHLAIIVFVAALYAKEGDHRKILTHYWTFWSTVKFPLYPDALDKCRQRWNLIDAL